MHRETHILLTKFAEDGCLRTNVRRKDYSGSFAYAAVVFVVLSNKQALPVSGNYSNCCDYIDSGYLGKFRIYLSTACLALHHHLGSETSRSKTTHPTALKLVQARALSGCYLGTSPLYVHAPKIQDPRDREATLTSRNQAILWSIPSWPSYNPLNPTVCTRTGG